MLIKKFNSYEDLHRDALAILKEHFSIRASTPHAVILPGGSTPFTLYSTLANEKSENDRRLHIILSDERYVPPSSPESNYGRMLPLLKQSGIDAPQILHPNTELPLDECADDYDHRLAEFFERGGRITLTILGIGTDGHTASLFGMQALKPSSNEFSVPVRKQDPPDRISLTAEMLRRSERIIFLCAGAEKMDIVCRIRDFPKEVLAAQAVQGVKNVQLWHSLEGPQH